MICRNELLDLYPGIDGDLSSVSEWMQGEPFEMSLETESMDGFSGLAERLLATYPDFPKEKERTNRILKLLRDGEEPWPLFVDDEGFVMEGRHRVVAFHIAKLSKIPVVRVRKAPSLDCGI